MKKVRGPQQSGRGLSNREKLAKRQKAEDKRRRAKGQEVFVSRPDRTNWFFPFINDAPEHTPQGEVRTFLGQKRRAFNAAQRKEAGITDLR